MESEIAYFCAPALAGIKPSNIFTYYKNSLENIDNELARLNSELNYKGIYIEKLCECEKRILLMVYRKTILENTLANAEMKLFLASYGYPQEGNANEYIEFLKHRLKGKEFSHEIGVFLGYPLHDIYGFMNHKNEGCLLCGEWKVYKNAEEAQQLFKRFTACRKAVVKRVTMGQTLAQIFCAVV